MYKVVKANDGTIRQISKNKSANNLITKEDTSAISLATTKADDFYEKEVTEYNRLYYVLDRALKLGFDGTVYELGIGDTCYIDAGTEYEMSGTFDVVVINQPAFGFIKQQ